MGRAAKGSGELSRRRRWIFRIAAATLVPFTLIGAVELGLRVAGYGYPTSFFVPLPEGDLLITNPKFGRRFFPTHLAREPVLDILEQRKPPGTYRIFLLGGSAAMGTPDPAYGVARILEVVLEERYPGADFDVVNGAMAAINSHVVREIARDAARHDPDLFIVYLGNNEVVGPFGPGTVFGRFTPSTAAVRWNLAVKRLRLGQLLDAMLSAVGDTPAAWRGMEMFVGRQVADDDLRLERVYEYLAANLADIVALGRAAGAETVLSTVAVNLRDSPPFSSANHDGLTAAEVERWRDFYRRGVAAGKRGDLGVAARAYADAAAIDDTHAELRYRMGAVNLAQGRHEIARAHLVTARDLDTLRFRADSRVNATIRRVAHETESTLVDAEEAFGDAAAVAGLPGGDLLWEHVHLTFPGNLRLATLLADSVAEQLPAATGAGRVAAPSPSAERIAARLALTDRETLAMAKTVLAMTGRTPFTEQAGHTERLRRRRAAVRALAIGSRSTASRDFPDDEPAADDLFLRQRRARRASERGDLEAAVAAWRDLVATVPTVARWQVELGFALAESDDDGAAGEAFARALALDPQGPETLVNSGVYRLRRGDETAAETLFRRALAADKANEGALLNLALLLEDLDRTDEAGELYEKAVGLHPGSPTSHRHLAEYLDRAGRLEEAVRHYRAAVALDPDQPATVNNLGFALQRLSPLDLAEAAYREALALDPGSPLAWFNLADLLLSTGRAEEAAVAYRSGLALDPTNAQARENLRAAETAATN